MKTLEAGVLYFALVFGAGFVLGTVRTLWVAPRLGSRTAEVIEMPIMLFLAIVSAKWIIDVLAVPSALSTRVVMGCIALVLMLVGEFTLVLWVRGMSIREYFQTRDPVSGAAYYVMLGVFAILPIFVARK
jgi:ABC-type uncharacterized transport system permease subunit